MDGDDVPRCVGYDCDHTVEYILIECGDFAQVRQKCYDAGNLLLFQEISDAYVLDFLHEIELFYRK